MLVYITLKAPKRYPHIRGTCSCRNFILYHAASGFLSYSRWSIALVQIGWKSSCLDCFRKLRWREIEVDQLSELSQKTSFFSRFSRFNLSKRRSKKTPKRSESIKTKSFHWKKYVVLLCHSHFSPFSVLSPMAPAANGKAPSQKVPQKSLTSMNLQEGSKAWHYLFLAMG